MQSNEGALILALVKAKLGVMHNHLPNLCGFLKCLSIQGKRNATVVEFQKHFEQIYGKQVYEPFSEILWFAIKLQH